MKYTVELKYINPSHEHVSLRRRVDTVTRLVEASSEQEALNRAANQQRALGFMIKEASVVKPEVIKEEVEQVDEAKKTKKEKLKALLYRDRSNVSEFGKGAGLTAAQKAAARKAIANEEVEQIDEISADMANRYREKAFFDKKDRSKGRALAFKKLGAMGKGAVKVPATTTKEEVEQVEEAKKPLKPTYWRAEWRLGTQTEVDKNNKKIYDRLAKTDPAKARAFHDNLMKMKKKDVKEETGADKRVAGYTMPPAVRAAQKKSDELSKVNKPAQAGTLAAARKMKARVAADKMVNKAKNNKTVNLEPSIESGKTDA